MLNKLLICFAVVLSLPILAGCDDDGYECSTKSRRPGEKLEFKEANFGMKIALSSKQPEWRFTEDRLYSRIEVKQEGREKVYWPRKRLMRFLSPHEIEFTDPEYHFHGDLFLQGTELRDVTFGGRILCGLKCEANVYILFMTTFLALDARGALVSIPRVYLCKFDEKDGLIFPYRDIPSDLDDPAYCSVIRSWIKSISIIKNIKMEHDYQRIICFYSVLNDYWWLLVKFNNAVRLSCNSGEIDVRQEAKKTGYSDMYSDMQYEALKYVLDTFDNNLDILTPDEETFARHIGMLPPGSSYIESIRQDRNRLIKDLWELDFLTDEKRRELKRVLDYIDKP